MDIYVVQQGDTINSIAEKFGVSVEKLITDNGIDHPDRLVVGQTIVIAYPKQTHIVQQGDTLQSIASTYNVPVIQLLRNNPFLSDMEYIYPGELLVISYNTKGSITTTGFAFPFINHETLRKILPSLTYLSIFNYRVQEDAAIYTYQDDSDIIKHQKSMELFHYYYCPFYHFKVNQMSISHIKYYSMKSFKTKLLMHLLK